MTLGWIPNAICVVRIVLIVPLVAALFAGRYPLALTLIVVAGFSDGLDGYLARRHGWRTRLGSVLDPAADKLLLMSSFVSLSLLGLAPLALTAIVILRDIVIVTGALIFQRDGGLRGEPAVISKLNTGCQLLFIIATIAQAEWQLPGPRALIVLGALVVFTSICSGLNYVLIWWRRARLAAPAH